MKLKPKPKPTRKLTQNKNTIFRTKQIVTHKTANKTNQTKVDQKKQQQQQQQQHAHSSHAHERIHAHT